MASKYQHRTHRDPYQWQITLVWTLFLLFCVSLFIGLYVSTEEAQHVEPAPTYATKSMDKCLADYKAFHGKSDAFEECVDILMGLRSL